MKSTSIILLIILLLSFCHPSIGNDENYAPFFSSVTVDGKNFSLNDCKGNVTILHIQNFENPLCIECEKEMRDQIIELAKISEEKIENITIVTINIRKNYASEDGKTLAEKWYKINLTWYWIEDFPPYSIANLYSKYYTVDGAFANPTILLINQSLVVIRVYHIYCMGKGEIDGLQKAESLLEDAKKILAGEFDIINKKSENKITFFGMFILGIITSFSPCSLALLISMISYVFAAKSDGNFKKEALIGLGAGISFTLGLSIIFFIIGIMISSIGFFVSISSLFYLIAGIILLILGINIFKPLKTEFGGQFKERGINFFGKLSSKSLFLGAFFLGIIFAVGWAPCAISLVLPVFILVMTQKATLLIGGMLLFAFGIGHGLPVIFLTTATRGMKARIGSAYIKAGKIIEKVFAVAIIVIAFLFILRYFGINFW
jgi:cytochrome c-type biogenesis protein